jgi:truncated hemoglobin YjbI|tara:strand:- start:8550 stop:8924 length:375 start_codon:yes stop_codon:yes gene_type:complete
MIDKMVKNELNQKVWSFSEIANVSETVDNLAEILYEKMPTTDKLKMVWDTEVFAEERTPFGQMYMNTVMTQLKIKIAEVVREQLLDAKVSFKEEIKNENAKRSVGGKSSKKRTTDEEKSSQDEE